MTMTQEPLTALDAIRAIRMGDFDADFGAITDAIKARKAKMSVVAFHAFKVGDVVELTNLRPTYLVGVKVRIVDKNRTRLVVRIVDEDRAKAGRFAYADFTAKPNMLRAVGA